MLATDRNTCRSAGKSRFRRGTRHSGGREAVGQAISQGLVAKNGVSTDNGKMLDPDQLLAELIRRDRRYHRDAYFFVFEALRYAQDHLEMGQPQPALKAGHKEGKEGKEERHVTGQQLCEAIRQYAVGQYGFLAKSVLNEWGIQSTGDFGEIVFNLIDVGQMRKTESDRREDFENVFDFDEGLRDAFQPMTPSNSRKERRL
jgi:uncharacterized repeat protein (TIGR04138 family)